MTQSQALGEVGRALKVHGVAVTIPGHRPDVARLGHGSAPRAVHQSTLEISTTLALILQPAECPLIYDFLNGSGVPLAVT